MTNQVKIFVSVIGILIVGIIVAVVLKTTAGPAAPGKYDDFAKCLTEKGLKFYGAFWCPHCQAQKKAFGSSEQYLPYIECSLPDGQHQNQTCNDAGITGYPTWKMPDGTIIPNDTPLPGAGVELQTLADKSGCALPQ